VLFRSRVRRTESIPDEYSIELSRHLSPISLAITAPVDVDFDGAPPRHIRQPDGPYATIDPQPGYGAGEFKPMELGITLLPNDTVKVDRAIAVDSVSVTQPLISEPKETVPGSVTIDTAMIWVGGSHEPKILPSGAPLRWHFIHGTAAVDRIALSKGNMTIRLHGIVDSLSLKDTAGGATDLMPNWYAELGVAKVTTLAIIVGGLTALLLLRLARPQFAFTSRDE